MPCAVKPLASTATGFHHASQRRSSDWILGNTIDGTQAEHARIPYADTSLYKIPTGVDEEALVMLNDILHCPSRAIPCVS